MSRRAKCPAGSCIDTSTRRFLDDEGRVRLPEGYFVDEKTGHVHRKKGKLPKCDVCEKKSAHVLMQIGEYKDDCVLATCDRCINHVCEGCCDVDADGGTVCTDCLQTDAFRRRVG